MITTVALFLLSPGALEIDVKIGSCALREEQPTPGNSGRIDAGVQGSDLVVRWTRPGAAIVERKVPDPLLCGERARAVRLFARAWALELESPLSQPTTVPLEGPRRALRAPLPAGVEFTSPTRPPVFAPEEPSSLEEAARPRGPLWVAVGVGMAAIASGAALQFGPEDATRAGTLFLPISLYTLGGAAMTVGLLHDLMP